MHKAVDSFERFFDIEVRPDASLLALAKLRGLDIWAAACGPVFRAEHLQGR